jgi:transcriptional regulator with XRE-family HTH domain
LSIILFILIVFGTFNCCIVPLQAIMIFGGRVMNTIGNRIEELRIQKKITQAALADSLGVKRETVYQWESGTRDLKTGAIIGLAKHLNVSTDWLLGLSDIKSYNLNTQSIHKSTGLSEKAIMNLRQIKKAGEDGSLDNPLRFINALLENENTAIGICEKVSELIRGNPSDTDAADKYTMDGGRYWVCQNTLTDIIKQLVEKEGNQNGRNNET